MPRITPGNHLYFYQLFSEKLGVGKQTTLQRIEEVMAEADVLLDDVDFETIEELLEELSDFVKLTVFKKGRVFATVMQREDLDLLLEKAAQPVVDKAAAAAGKSWKRTRRSKDIRPTKPRHKKKPLAEIESVTEGETAEAVAPQESVDVVTEEPSMEVKEPELTVEDEAIQAEAPQAEAEPEVEAMPEPEAATEVEPEPAQELGEEPEPEPELQPEPEPEPKAEPQVVQESEPDPEPEPEVEPQPEPILEDRNPQRIRTTAKLRRISLPVVFSEEVYCPSEQLRELYQLLPDTIGIMDALDEGWKFAQQAGTVEGTRSSITFPLSRTNLPGYPIEVTVKRVARIPTGKAWQLVSVIRDEDDDEDSDEDISES